MRELTDESYDILFEYLYRHEDDIAADINDFGDLKILYIDVMKVEPHE